MSKDAHFYSFSRYSDKPDYDLLLNAFKGIMERSKTKLDDPWDWENDYKNVVDEEYCKRKQ